MLSLTTKEKETDSIEAMGEVIGRAQKRTWSSNGPFLSSNHKATRLPLPLPGGRAGKGECCLRGGLNGDSPFTARAALSGEAQTPELSIAGESSLSCAGPIDLFRQWLLSYMAPKCLLPERSILWMRWWVLTGNCCLIYEFCLFVSMKYPRALGDLAPPHSLPGLCHNVWC